MRGIFQYKLQFVPPQGPGCATRSWILWPALDLIFVEPCDWAYSSLGHSWQLGVQVTAAPVSDSGLSMTLPLFFLGDTVLVAQTWKTMKSPADRIPVAHSFI